jgi:hypothetical protein
MIALFNSRAASRGLAVRQYSLFEKRAQVTIFIIVGLVVVVGLLVAFFLISKDGPENIPPVEMGPREFVISCVEDAIEESVEKMLRNGGEISPSHTIAYQGSEWNYLCYQGDYYLGCYNLHPMLELQVEKEIESDTAIAVQTCFNDMRQSFEDAGFAVNMGGISGGIDLLPGYIEVDLMREITISDDEGSRAFEDFGFDFSSPIYDLIRVAREIVNSESQFCHFENNGYMLLYPQFDIRRNSYMDSNLYQVIDRRTGAEFKFAVRSCAFPPGI